MTARPSAIVSTSDNRRLWRQMLSYGVIGVVSASLDTAVFWTLVNVLEVAPQPANVVGILCGISLSFGLNRLFTFAVLDRTIQRFATFLMVGLLGMALSAAILQLGIVLGINLLHVKIFSVLVVALIQFALNRAITFRRR